MKKLAYILVAGLVLFTTGCKKYVEGWDDNPNLPTTVTPALLLSASEVALIATMEGQLARTATIWSQQLTGTDFQMVNVNTYFVLEGDNTNEWGVVYQDGLVNLNEIVNTFGAANPWYSGIAKVVKAMLIGVATDCWGNIPYREAALGMGGEEFFAPNYDNQEQILSDILALLNEAKADLGQPADANVEFPGGDDYMFSGDVDAWMKIAYALQARYFNRLYGSDATGSANNAISAIESSGMTGNADNCYAMHDVAANANNQWFAFLINRGNYIKMSDLFITMLKDFNDPRLPFYAALDENGEYSGTPITSGDVTTSNYGTYLATNNGPFPLVTYAEVKFIEAECNLRVGKKDKAATAHNDGVKASLEEVTGEIDALYVTTYASETAASITLEKIMTQKYIAGFGQIETWTDWRRTQLPALTPNPDGVIAGIPVRFPNVLDERINNPNATIVSDKLEPVWWDKPYPTVD